MWLARTLGIAVVVLGVVGAAAAQAQGAVNPRALEQRLGQLGVRQGDAFGQAIEAHLAGRAAEAAVHVKAGLLANGVVEARNARTIVQALQQAATEQGPAAQQALQAFVQAHLAEAAGAGGGGAASAVVEGLITEEGFRALKTAGGLQRVDKGAGFVFLEVSPPSAKVTVGTREYAGSPVTAEGVESGYQRVVIEKDGYDPLRGYVLVEPLKVAKVRVVLPARPGNLTVLSEPSGAQVTVDGEIKGNSPLTVQGLPGGEHHVTMTSAGLSWSGTVTIGGGTEVIRATLKPATGAAANLASVTPVQPVAAAPPAPFPAPVAVPAPVASASAQPAVQLAPAAPVAAAAPAAAPRSSEVDLRTLSPDLRRMAWKKLEGRTVEIELSSGARTQVRVGEVREAQVILQVPGDQSRLVPMEHIVAVRE